MEVEEGRGSFSLEGVIFLSGSDFVDSRKSNAWA